MRIISLVPSITETLFDFGLTENEIVGRTKFCIYPKNKVKNVTIIGGTKNLNINKIVDLKPSLIIANKEENEKVQIEFLMKTHQVWLTEIKNINDNYSFLRQLGFILNKKDKALEFSLKIKKVFYNLPKIGPHNAIYLIWQNPYLSVGSDTFIHDIMTRIGLKNRFGNKKRYPEISKEDLEKTSVILLSTEPFPFGEKHVEIYQSSFPKQKILLVNGEVFSWYGTRLLHSQQYLIKLCKLLQNP